MTYHLSKSDQKLLCYKFMLSQIWKVTSTRPSVSLCIKSLPFQVPLQLLHKVIASMDSYLPVIKSTIKVILAQYHSAAEEQNPATIHCSSIYADVKRC